MKCRCAQFHLSILNTTRTFLNITWNIVVVIVESIALIEYDRILLQQFLNKSSDESSFLAEAVFQNLKRQHFEVNPPCRF